jgi:Protein phosphatase 2C.
MKAVFRTDRGKVRSHNEDAGGIFFKEEKGLVLAVVCDGMGGHLAGDVASQMAAGKMEKAWMGHSAISSPEEGEAFFRENIAAINTEIYQHSLQHEDCAGMGTTLVAALCAGSFATVASIGDSRCYVYNSEGLHQVTEDHSLVNELVKSGQISEEDAEHHPRKNILLRALGTEPSVEADIFTIPFAPGDYLILCSDGLSNKVSRKEMEEILRMENPIEEKAEKLIGLANENGGEDNITVAILHREQSSGKAGGETC